MSTELVERLKPSYAADKAAIEAAVQLRDKYPRLTEALNSAIVANNALKSEAVAELTALTAKVALLTEALRPFATVAPHGTFGGPLVCLTPIYEDGSDKKYSPSPLIGPEAVRAARRALSEPDKDAP